MIKLSQYQKERLERLKVYTKEDFPEATWYEDPTKFLYVRMSDTLSCSPNYKGSYKLKIIGKTKSKKIGFKLYEGSIFWLKEFDIGMSRELEGYANAESFRGYPIEAVRFLNEEVQND